MLRLNDTIDLVRRRTNGCLNGDGIDTVYCIFKDNKEKAELLFVHKEDIDSKELTKLAVRYQHLFETHRDVYTIRVLPLTNYFQKTDETYAIWQCRKEFAL